MPAAIVNDHSRNKDDVGNVSNNNNNNRGHNINDNNHHHNNNIYLYCSATFEKIDAL